MLLRACNDAQACGYSWFRIRVQGFFGNFPYLIVWRLRTIEEMEKLFIGRQKVAILRRRRGFHLCSEASYLRLALGSMLAVELGLGFVLGLRVRVKG
jgi:hypothetical protein